MDVTAIENLVNSNPFLIPVLIWSLLWKGIALRRASRNNQRHWFIALLLINTVGLVEIVDLLWFEKNKNEQN